MNPAPQISSNIINPFNSLIISLSLHIGLFLFFLFLYHHFYRPTIFEPVRAFSLVSLPKNLENIFNVPENSIKKPALPKAPSVIEKTRVPAQEKVMNPAAQAQTTQASADSVKPSNIVQASGGPVSQGSATPSTTGYDESKIIPTYKPEVQYPEVARQLGIQGRLVAILTINSKGEVENVDILISPHPSISRAAQKTLKQWKFKIGVQSGFSPEARYLRRQEITFSLNDPEE